MSFGIYQASVPVFVNALTNMRAWLDKAAAEKPEAELVEARLAPDMRPLTFQYQSASDSAKFAVARLTGVEAPSMPDTEASFAELRERCDKTIAFVKSVDPSAFADSAGRTVELKFPNGMGYRLDGQSYLTGFALPNFFFHVTTAYAILRASGVSLGKPDFLQHLGQPNIQPGS
ncbi:hypothetical protein SCH01S_51_01110 [Sphingomonas changbaiensis NBRC 104936]|uniref:DUF1993 domain-containing protein n=1 Tax=Sphingomonas changbaiensis NBRC 104936 TaxID=1219043 RepID=A0A0E9MTG3_9SPHN|nr:DUF1993 domain-containing protein [Sphingomonas changbaiensis]GAO40778.1 hypothetical protein SCH01S_51_01110 [Sphingomonas changbaiensis NBRC 104936]